MLLVLGLIFLLCRDRIEGYYASAGSVVDAMFNFGHACFGECHSCGPCGGVPADLATLETVLTMFQQYNGRFPTPDEGLRILAERPSESASTWRQLMDTIPTDPWGREYYYVVSPAQPRGYDLFSLGPNPADSSDDIHLKS